MQIKHLSFDLWLTLIKSNECFKAKRAEALSALCADRVGKELVLSGLRQIDKTADRYNELTGKKLPAREMFAHALCKIGIEKEEICAGLASEALRISDELFLEHLPQLIDERVPHLLQSLKDRGYRISLSSNTGFIEHCTLQVALEAIDISRYFDFMVFSDAIGSSKPSAYFYSHVQNLAGCLSSNILHIGDNPRADYVGAQRAGFHALLVDPQVWMQPAIEQYLNK